MAKKLTEDQIKWILSVESTEAQQNIRALTKANRELQQANKERNAEMVKLEMRGKKNSRAYQNLSAEVKNNSAQLNTNREMIRQLEKSLSLTDLTMGQLKKRSQDLTRQLDNTSKNLHPEEYAALEKELNGVKNRMFQLRDESKLAQKSLGKMISTRGAVATFFGNLLTKGAALLVALTKKAKEFVAEGIRIAGAAQGIEYAFNRIANKDFLKSLRESTKGLVSDLTLMKATVRASNFNIPLEQLGTLLQFAQNRARDTGESVDYLVDSIVNGIGRKSPLILDNLGISAVRLNAEVKKTGNFAEAVGKIIEEEMTKAGTAIDTAADTATRKKVAWENLQLSLGRIFVNIKKGWDNVIIGFINGLNKIVSGGEDAKKVYDDQINKVADLEVNTGTLVKRYEELKSKTKLNKEEQEELARVMNTISKTVPGVTNEFDAYGNALSINTDKVWAYIAAEKERLKILNREAIANVEKKLNNSSKELDDINSKITAGGRTAYRQTSSFGTYTSDFITYTDKEIDDFKKRKAILEKEVQDYSDTKSFLDGTSIEEQKNIAAERVKQRNKFNTMNKEQLAAWIADEKNAASEYMKIATETYNFRFGETIGGDSGGGKEKAYAAELKQLDAQLKKEQAAIKSQYEANKIDQNEFFRQSLEAEYDFLDKKLHIKGLEESDRKIFQNALIANLDQQKLLEEMKLNERLANEEIRKTEHQQAMEELEREYFIRKMDIYNLDMETQIQVQDKIFEYRLRMLEKIHKIESDYFEEEKRKIQEQDKKRDADSNSLTKRLAQSTQKQLDNEKEKLLNFRKDMVSLTTTAANDVGALVGGAVSGNRDMVKESIVSLINMGLDYLKIQTQLAVTGATMASLAQPDSVATFGASGFARALLMTGLIEAAFQAVKAVVGGLAGKIGSSSSSDGSSGTTRVLAGRESGGWLDVEREQDGKRYRATYAPNRRGYVNQPTIIAGEGPAGKSKEWIAPNDALQNPTIAPFIELLEQSRLQGTIRTIDLNQIMRGRMAGFETGGYLYDNPLAEAMRNNPNTPDSTLLRQKESTISATDKTLMELNGLLKQLRKDGVSVNYQQFDKSKQLIDNIKSKAARG